MQGYCREVEPIFCARARQAALEFHALVAGVQRSGQTAKGLRCIGTELFPGRFVVNPVVALDGLTESGLAIIRPHDHRYPRAAPCAGASDSLDDEARTASCPSLPFQGSVEIVTFCETQAPVAKGFDTQLSLLAVRRLRCILTVA